MSNIQTQFSFKNMPKRMSLQLGQNQASTHRFKSDKKVSFQAHTNQQLEYAKQSSECSTMDVQTPQDFSFQQQFISTQKVDEIYRKSVDWMTKNQRKLRIKIQTFYLAVSYLVKFISLGGKLIQQNYQKISVVMILLSSKMNEIYSVQLQDILLKCDLATTKQQLIQLQSQVLRLFHFQMAIQSNCYSIIKNSISRIQNGQRSKNAQKILFMSIFQYQTFEFGQEYLAYAIIYLIQPQNLKHYQVCIENTKIIASKIYQKYLQKRSFHQQSIKDV